MPYITTERVSEIRNNLKKEFPNFKFSIRKENHSSVNVDILEAPFNMLRDETKTYETVNHFYINDTFKDFPEAKEVLIRINEIMNATNGVFVEDGDYGTVPNYYTNLSIGSYDKPFKVVERKAKANDLKSSFEKMEVPVGKIQIIDYSERAIAVIGDTKPIKDKLKELGGKFNFRLSCGAGWIFRKVDFERIKEALMPKEVAHV